MFPECALPAVVAVAIANKTNNRVFFSTTEMEYGMAISSD